MPPNPTAEAVRQPLTTRNIVRPTRVGGDGLGGAVAGATGAGAPGDDHDHSLAKSPQKRAQVPVYTRPSLIPRPKAAQDASVAPPATAATARAMAGRMHRAALPRLARLPEADFAAAAAAAAAPAHGEPSPRDHITTPKKRAVPVEDVHVRNAPGGGSPSKRSRSSKSGTGSSTHEPSTGTTTSLAQDLSGVKVAEATTTTAPGGVPALVSTATTAAASSSHVSKHASVTTPGAAHAAAPAPAPAPAAIVRPIRPMHSVAASNTKATTTRIDRQSRVTDQERAARDRQAFEERKIWRHKFKKAFPSFVFYFDAFDEATVKDLTGVIQSLGGSVDQFFSRNVTHLITTRLVPSATAKTERHEDGKENSPTKEGATRDGARHKLLRPTVSKSRLSPTKGSAAAAAAAAAVAGGERPPRNSQPLYSERNPFDDAGPPASGSNDILLKAQSFGMKVWRHDKLTTILRMLVDEPVVSAATAAAAAAAHGAAAAGKQHDLSQMLEREKLYGTHERDPNASRNDHHYFRKGNFYLLVEDATMEHRPIMCSEFEYGRQQQQEGLEPPWPVLYGELEGRCPFTRYDLTEQQRNRIGRGRNVHTTLRRAVSLSNMARRHTGPPSPRPPNEGFLETPRGGGYGGANDHHHHHHHPQPYQLASGNSVSITSNIASTTSTALTDQVGTIAGLPQDRRVAELNRRMHTPLAHSPTTRLPASPASFIAGADNSGGSGLGITAADVGSGSGSSMATPGGYGGRGGAGDAANPHHNTPAAAAHSRGAVVRRMLGMTEHDAKRPSVLAQQHVQQQQQQAGIRRSVSTSAVVPVRPQEKRPGYCENCRIKYDNFDDHVISRKHRKFAVDDSNFVDIDQLILRVQRPLGAGYMGYSGDEGEGECEAGHVGGDEAAWQHYGGSAHGYGDADADGEGEVDMDRTLVDAAEYDDDAAEGGGFYEEHEVQYGDGDGDGDEEAEYEEEEEVEGDDEDEDDEHAEYDDDEDDDDDDDDDDERGEGAGDVRQIYDEDAEWHRQASIHYATSGHVSHAASNPAVAAPEYLQVQMPVPRTPLPALSRRAADAAYNPQAADVNEISSPYV
ncbi:uncharacterized protein PFL1_06267 [Pseudozyma flocculosa PF-1]|uniref:DBF4-type domain-containing protein n=2 Tax=Pseudozyma flocculosa TaxID=84751 RepID=A0A5C3FA67_9BASI|nr:uncharacterized protein PFL1_06267 [Pseudozyma flocculosa PF-1]EPQ26058.1 hypothetical protein PFL1_06267 [Pseudozyma flocculosa PF-1]SPO40301.1 uncharacterized protein PSFLO_05783 [Pseudozyma flocculosa]